jgi:hypothetical protein
MPQAYQEYGFHVGDEIAFAKGSRTSGGFFIGLLERLPLLGEFL